MQEEPEDLRAKAQSYAQFSDREREAFQSGLSYAYSGKVNAHANIEVAMVIAGLQPQAEEPRETITMDQILEAVRDDRSAALKKAGDRGVLEKDLRILGVLTILEATRGKVLVDL